MAGPAPIVYETLMSEIQAALAGFGLRSQQRTFLANSCVAGDLTLVTATGGAANLTGRIIEIEDEVIDVLSDDGNNTLTIAPDGRGFQGTTAASHAANKRIIVDPPFPRWRIQQAINETIDFVYPRLYGVASTQFTFNPAVHNYSLPALATNVLKVECNTLGPTLRQVELARYVFNAAAAAPEFASTGKSITLNEFPAPGRTVTVWYSTEPVAIGPGDLFTASGLSDSAKSCILYGTLSRLLATVDLSRSLTNSATEYEFGAVGTNRVGTGASLIQSLEARHESELLSEQRELNKRFPKRLRISTRF